MKSIEELLTIINNELSRQDFSDEPKELFEPINYIISLGGKRIRPVLTLMCCEMFGGDIKDALNPALGVELFHNFTLIHDDILDNAVIRRGKPTVVEKWGTNIAILSGDTMFAISYKYIFETKADKIIPVLKIFNDTVVDVCKGQQYDMNYETEANISIENYTEMIRLKTAVLLGSCAKTGAVIAGASEDNANKIYLFAEKLGVAFQLKDDLLDVYGNQDLFGKQTGGDIQTNKKTFLFLKALELANPEQRKSLLYYFSKTEINTTQKVAAVKQIFNDLDIKKYTETEIEKYYIDALSCINAIDIAQSNKVIALDFASQLMKREY